jgi:hypothetical protein
MGRGKYQVFVLHDCVDGLSLSVNMGAALPVLGT